MGSSQSTVGRISGISSSHHARTNSNHAPSPVSLFGSKSPIQSITNKLSKANLSYDIGDLQGYYEIETLTYIIKESIEHDKKIQLTQFLKTGSSNKDVSDFKYQYKPKIFITDIKTLDVAKLIVPSKVNPFGFVHTCLKIGPLYFEWNNSSIINVSFSVYDLKQAILVIDLEDENIESTKIDKTEDKMISDISKIVSEWNVNYEYDPLTKNCQKFVEAMMKDGFGLIIKKYPDYIQNIFDNLHKLGKYKIENIFKNTIFKDVKTHADLDYISHIKEIHADFNTDNYALGKSLDRAFWFNYFSLIQYQQLFNKTKKDFEKATKFLDVYEPVQLLQCLDYVLELKYLEGKFPEKIEDLHLIKMILTKEPNSFIKEEEGLKRKLKEIYDSFISIAEEKDTDLIQQIEMNQPIHGKEFIRRFYEEMLTGDAKNEFLKCYEKENGFHDIGYYPKKQKLKALSEKFKEHIIVTTNISIMWDKYDEETCYCRNPHDTHSIRKNYK
eukprot:gene3107-5277_t